MSTRVFLTGRSAGLCDRSSGEAMTKPRGWDKFLRRKRNKFPLVKTLSITRDGSAVSAGDNLFNEWIY